MNDDDARTLAILSWNMNGLAAWDDVIAQDVDVALLQEAPRPPVDVAMTILPDPAGARATTGWLPGRWSRRTAILGLPSRVTLVGREDGVVGDLDATGLPVSRPGTITVADLDVDGERFTVAAVFGGWERPPGQASPI